MSNCRRWARHTKPARTIAVVESVKAASDIYAPAKGTVLEVNKALESNPALLNTDPYGEGWIYLLQVENADQLKELKDAAAYRAAIGKSMRRGGGVQRAANNWQPTGSRLSPVA